MPGPIVTKFKLTEATTVKVPGPDNKLINIQLPAGKVIKQVTEADGHYALYEEGTGRSIVLPDHLKPLSSGIWNAQTDHQIATVNSAAPAAATQVVTPASPNSSTNNLPPVGDQKLEVTTYTNAKTGEIVKVTITPDREILSIKNGNNQDISLPEGTKIRSSGLYNANDEKIASAVTNASPSAPAAQAPGSAAASNNLPPISTNSNQTIIYKNPTSGETVKITMTPPDGKGSQEILSIKNDKGADVSLPEGAKIRSSGIYDADDNLIAAPTAKSGAATGSAKTGSGNSFKEIAGKDGSLAGTLKQTDDKTWILKDKDGKELGTYNSEKAANSSRPMSDLREYGKTDVSILERAKAHPYAAFLAVTAVMGLATQWNGKFDGNGIMAALSAGLPIGMAFKSILNMNNLAAFGATTAVIVAIAAIKKFGKTANQTFDPTKDPSQLPNTNQGVGQTSEAPAPRKLQPWYQSLGTSGLNYFLFTAGAVSLSLGLSLTDSKLFDSKQLKDSAATAFQQELSGKVQGGKVTGSLTGKAFIKTNGDTDTAVYVTKNVGEDSGYTVYKQQLNKGGYALSSDPLAMLPFFWVDVKSGTLYPSEKASAAMGTQNAMAAAANSPTITSRGAAVAATIGAMQGHDIKEAY
jgi:hypothetical protein